MVLFCFLDFSDSNKQLIFKPHLTYLKTLFVNFISDVLLVFIYTKLSLVNIL